MSNVENIDLFINVMKKVERKINMLFSMEEWFNNENYEWGIDAEEIEIKTEQQAIECGTICCLGGWASLDADCNKKGFVVRGGHMQYKLRTGASAVAEFLEISFEDASDLCCIDDDSNFYEMPIDMIQPENVIQKLIQLKKGEDDE